MQAIHNLHSMLLSNTLLLFLLSFIHLFQCYHWNISTAISNIPAVIACGLSIDIYPSFDPAQVIICPYVWIEKDKIQLIHLNISFDDYNHQLITYSNPPLLSPPQVLIKLNNNSFRPPLNLTQTSTYYLSFSSELLCRFSVKENDTICFYYPTSSRFLHIEYHYDEIRHGSLILPEISRHRFYIIFLLITIFIVIICFFAVCIVCTKRSTFFHPTQLDVIIDTQMARQEAARRPRDPLQDGEGGHHHILADVKEPQPGDG